MENHRVRMIFFLTRGSLRTDLGTRGSEHFLSKEGLVVKWQELQGWREWA